ncbi:glycerate kinase [Poritiphilus flavus]|uniref:Glycerate kinase n=1 Tax=Poritiphilus flavus TaxID=2697053 RepID=A0A6L9EBA2_9FLAO|nr:glycerate kinase [Poritiphilus flavus]NAS11990.1 glycerate kinase [Poritiphilus flavus]
MRFLLIPDKFKGSLSARDVIQAISEGIVEARPSAQFHHILASDGGDGFLDAVRNYLEVERIIVDTLDPLGRPVQAPYLYDSQNQTAYLELAAASGLVLLKEEERDAMQTSTIGSGIQIQHAISKGARRVYLGLGGSATNDGGMGMASTLGYKFLDQYGNALEPTGANLRLVQHIDESEVSPNLGEISFFAINDVNNPLYGPEGAAYVYAEQKGADQKEIGLLDDGLKQLHKTVARILEKEVADVPGSGAAGGSAFGLKAFFGAEYISGIDFILNLAGADRLLEEEKIDFIITGEGRIDDQTLHGKLISGVLTLGQRYEVPVMAVCGMLDTDSAILKKQGLKEILEVRDPEKPLSYNMENAFMLIKKAFSDFFRQ